MVARPEITELLADPARDWQRKPPATARSVDTLIAQSSLHLPDDYVALLRYSNGGAGKLGVEPGWFEIWPAEDVLQLNQEYAVREFAPHFFAFGSNGGGEMFALDIRQLPHSNVFMIPFVGMDEDRRVVVVDDFGAFIHAMGQRAA